MLTSERIQKLPVWAQKMVEQQASRVRSLEAELTAIRGESDGDVWVGHSVSNYNTPLIRLPRRTEVRFRLLEGGDDDSEDWANEITCRIRGNLLEIAGGDSLVILPACGNVVHVMSAKLQSDGTIR